MKDKDIITIDHGSGGKLTLDLIENVFMAEQPSLDAAILDDNIAFTTDSHSIQPLFFKGGDIGKLSISGTVNDLLCVGAQPLYISSGFIIEDGFEIESLKKIAQSMRKEAEKANVKIVCGDTKVIENKYSGGVFINTSGIGKVIKLIDGSKVKDGDDVIVTGTIGDHGFSILNEREGFNLQSNLSSDCSSLVDLIMPIIKSDCNIKFMRDPTRGGLAMCLNELCYKRKFGIDVYEDKIPVKKEVLSMSEMLGIEPYYSANEGKMVIISDKKDSADILNILKKHPLGENAEIIGKVTSNNPSKVILHRAFGTSIILNMPVSDKMPRIC